MSETRRQQRVEERRLRKEKRKKYGWFPVRERGMVILGGPFPPIRSATAEEVAPLFGFEPAEIGKQRAYNDLLAEALVLLRRCQPCGPIPLRAIVAEFLERAAEAGYQ